MKLKQRVVITCVGLATLTIFYLLVETVYKINPNRLPTFLKNSLSNVGHEYDGSHISAIRKRLNKSNYTSDDFSPEGGGDKVSGVGKDTLHSSDDRRSRKDGVEHWAMSPLLLRINNTDSEVDLLLHKLQNYDRRKFDFTKLKPIPYYEYLKTLRKRIKRKGTSLDAFRTFIGSLTTSWERFHKGIHQYHLYSPDDSTVDDLLRDVAQEPIVDVEQKEGGTQLKLIITFSDEGQALFKPMRYPREQETLPNHFYFSDYERHNAEVAAFHLDRVLGFYRVPPTAGRVVNMTRDIKRLADHKLSKTFFISPANNLCFHGSCSYYCDSGHAICGSPDLLESSMAAFLPPEKIAARKTWRNPWKRSYSKHRKAYWEVYDDLCDKVKTKSPYNTGRRLLDLMDTHVFDFMTGNLDRHHYETFKDFGNDTFHLHLDNGRSFGKWRLDDMSILAPVFQCCKIRYSTFMKLAKFYIGPDKLSALMKAETSRDKLFPVLIQNHLIALDRRVIKILKEIYICIQNGNDISDVIEDDHF
ncbi:extracellular serine/threonine protein kinase FAM20C-like [Mizuhopecten yessoensis]|uniref:Extracellular serine/threonine protein kinase FAM20C n=2 Tax=Mizuhopecten yessoensis TaxID=6573 RepID=A0A210QA84_MIZYE|nr:extracellular serine/threonine protein kinase FAM20C-like [Mizuhopecten yessoensis]OWF45619.1 Extracellular serine/threonine protein kinase FAM20C [Mizuhopecten yessoensis]